TAVAPKAHGDIGQRGYGLVSSISVGAAVSSVTVAGGRSFANINHDKSLLWLAEAAAGRGSAVPGKGRRYAGSVSPRGRVPRRGRPKCRTDGPCRSSKH